MTDKVQKFRKEVERLKSNLIHGACSSQVAMETRCKEEAYDDVLAILDTMQEEPVSTRDKLRALSDGKQHIGWLDDAKEVEEESVSEDLGEYINELSKQFPEVSFTKLSRIAVRVSRWQQNQDVKNKLPKVTNRTDLDEYAYQCAYNMSNDWAIENPTWHDVEDACKLGANWQKQQDQSTIELAEDHAMLAGMEKMKEQMMKNIWKPADGDDLPEIDREVVVFTQNFPDDAGMMRVAIGHRPNPDGWEGKSLSTGKVEHYTPKTYDKGGWNIPDIVYWLDVKLPKEIEL